MSEFPSNSNTKRAPRPETTKEAKKVERVVESEVVRRKQPLGKRMRNYLIGGDAKSAWTYVLLDMVLPDGKRMFLDWSQTFMERVVLGEDARRSPSRGSRSGVGQGFISYNKIGQGSRPSRDDDRRPISRRGRASHDFDEIILATRVEAEEVVDRLFDLVSRYETATVADLYELVGVSANFTDDKWGWNDLRGAGVSRVRNGYLLDLPRPEPLD
jgi:hypothetical protein